MEDKNQQSSVYNEASLQILRLHLLWVKIEESINHGKLVEWQWLLDSVWRELRADVEHLEKPTEIVEEHTRLRNNCKTRKGLYEALNARHEFLKKLQDRCGKGSKYQDTELSEFTV